MCPSIRFLLPPTRLAKALRRTGVVLCAACAVAATPPAALAIDWDDAGNSASKLWSDNGNWNPDGSPSGLAVNIGNLANAANDRTLVDAFFSIASLSVTNGADVVNSTDEGATNDFRLLVNGATSVSGSGSSIVVYGGDVEGLDTNTLTLSGGGTLVMNSSTPQGTAVVQVDSGLFDVQSGGVVTGAGEIRLDDSLTTATTLLRNDGAITANTPTVLVFQAPAAGTLQINALDPLARFDWDGSSGAGVLNINGNQTLDVNVAPSDSFDGTMNLATGSTLDVSSGWTLSGGAINANTAAFGLIIVGQDPAPGPAAHIAGAAFTMTGGTITLADSWDSLTLDAALTATGGVINNSGVLTFNAPATFSAGSDFNMTGGGAAMVVNADVTIDTPDFNLDGQGLSGNKTTIRAGATLDLNLGAGADEDFDHTIELDGGTLDVATLDNTWSITSIGEVHATGLSTSVVNGEALTVNGDVRVDAGSRLNVNAQTQFNSTAAVTIGAGGQLNMGTVTYSGGSYTGAGVLSKGNATIAANTTWGVDTVNLDDGVTTVLNGAALVVNTTSIDDAGDGIDAQVTIENTGQATFNIVGGGDVVFDAAGRLTYNGDATPNTFLPAPAGGSALRFDTGSVFTVNGDGVSSARIKLNGGTLTIASPGEQLRLAGGSIVPGGTNEIAGGAINGPGGLAMSGTTALRGHGTIDTRIDGTVSTQLIAEGGTLSINNVLGGVGTIGTVASGVLDVALPWNTNVAGIVALDRGVIQGATITNDGNGFRGRGTVTARVINNSSIVSTTTDTLVMDNPLNDWDGTTGAGVLRATQGTLELRDNASFNFTGTVQGDGGLVFANGFALQFQPGSTMRLSSGGYRATATTSIGGAVDVLAGAPSTISVAGQATFESSSATSLAADLHLDNTTTNVRSGASFSGAGELVNLAARQLNLSDGVNLGVQVTNRGRLTLASSLIGRADVADFQQTSTGGLTIDIAGTGLGQFDRLVANGIVDLAGTLTAAATAALPLGTTVTAITAPGGVVGTFDAILAGGVLPGPGLEWKAVYNPTSVQLVLDLTLPGDFNNDGVVDAADYTVWRDALGTASTLPGDPTPGAVTQSDYDVWAANYGSVAAGPSLALATSVPEPTALSLASLALAAWRGRGRRD